ncbi:hypothetical protein [Mesorhizobium sp. M0590]|uniref:hypothetical protein n=1 Tax=Mesorhizobium sp. M0590 TaxID=2956966 RepID=UPI0033353DB7
MHDLADAKRNRFFAGKRMQADEYNIEQSYEINRRRLINRAVLGWGVVQGFALSQPDRPKIEVVIPDEVSFVEPDVPDAGGSDAAEPVVAEAPWPEPRSPAQDAHPAPAAPIEDNTPYPLWVGDGIAFDRHGREVVHARNCSLDGSNTFYLFLDNGHWCARDLSKLPEGRYILSVHYAEEKTGGIIPPRFCGCGHPERAYVRETAVFSLRKWDEKKACPCGEFGCPGDRCKDCVADACKGDVRGPHARLSQWVMDRDIADHDSHLDCWGKYEIAMHEWIELACLTVQPGDKECDPVKVVIDDASGPRRLVKNNDLLFDLVRGCDLTHISSISWGDWHRRGRGHVPWSDFKKMFHFHQELRHEFKHQPGTFFKTYRTNFFVNFSGPVLRKSIRPDIVTIRVNSTESGTGWGLVRVVPISWLDSTPSNGDEGSLFTDQFRIEVRRKWANDEIKEDGLSELRGHDFFVEIEVRGDLIEDCNGLTVDASSRGLDAVPTGNGTPGGTFISRFGVRQMPQDQNDAD